MTGRRSFYFLETSFLMIFSILKTQHCHSFAIDFFQDMIKFLLTTVRNNIMNKPNECLGEQEDLNKSFFLLDTGVSNETACATIST